MCPIFLCTVTILNLIKPTLIQFNFIHLWKDLVFFRFVFIFPLSCLVVKSFLYSGLFFIYRHVLCTGVGSCVYTVTLLVEGKYKWMWMLFHIFHCWDHVIFFSLIKILKSETLSWLTGFITEIICHSECAVSLKGPIVLWSYCVISVRCLWQAATSEERIFLNNRFQPLPDEDSWPCFCIATFSKVFEFISVSSNYMHVYLCNI